MNYLIGYFVISFFATIFVTYFSCSDENLCEDGERVAKIVVLNFFLWPLITPITIGFYLHEKKEAK